MHIICQVHPLVPQEPVPEVKPVDVAKFIAQIGEGIGALSYFYTYLSSPEKLVLPVVVVAAVFVYWFFGLMFHLDVILMY